MKKQQSKICLSTKTTFRIGGAPEAFLVPESIGDMQEAIDECISLGMPHRIIGKGSNLLVSDRGLRGSVISLERCGSNLNLEPDGFIRAGAGVPLSRFILESIKSGLFGHEYLSSVPGTIGGAVFMNAGTWLDKNQFISDYLVEVEYYDGKKQCSIPRDQCEFGYRRSIFQRHPHWIILSASFKVPLQPTSLGTELRRNRLIWSKENQDVRYGNAGSVFRAGHGRPYKMLRGLRLGRAGWSKKTGNWINNYGDASFHSVMRMIRIGKLMHAIFAKKSDLEIVVWNDGI
jgi:UDP-N-acetylmuramate dehydrogenase